MCLAADGEDAFDNFIKIYGKRNCSVVGNANCVVDEQFRFFDPTIHACGVVAMRTSVHICLFVVSRTLILCVVIALVNQNIN